MEEKLKYWEKRYHLQNLQLVGYSGGYPMIQFAREEDMALNHMSEREIKRMLRGAENRAGIELGVAYSLRKTAFLMKNDATVVICGHELVLDRVLKQLFF